MFGARVTRQAGSSGGSSADCNLGLAIVHKSLLMQ